jgi:C4-dicarboxylate-specific signal transduction histidine kinase
LRIQWISAYTWTFVYLIGVALHFDSMAKLRERELGAALDRQSVAYGMVVHDISSYLANAQYAAQLLEKGNLENHQRHEVAGYLVKDISRLDQLVTILRNQLGYQLSPSGIKQHQCHLGDAFNEAIGLLKVRRKLPSQCLFVASEAASSLVLNARQDELIQIIDNLAVNASDAVNRSKCDRLVFLMDVDVWRVNSMDRITLSFSDNGPGISSQIVEKILLGEPRVEEVTNSQSFKKSFGLRLISNYLDIFGGRLRFQTPAEGPMVSSQKTEGTWGELPGTSILLDIPSSMIANFGKATADPHLPPRRSA